MIHPTAHVSSAASIGHDTRVWHHAQICDGARVGDECIVGNGVYIDRDVAIGNRVKIQSGAQLYRGTAVDDGAFIGPLVCVANDRYPRSITPNGRLKTDADWIHGKTLIEYGASLGAGAIVLPSVVVGRFAMVAAGAVVVESVPSHGLVLGTPGRLTGYVCACGRPLASREATHLRIWQCSACGADYVELGDRGLCLAPKPESDQAVG